MKDKEIQFLLTLKDQLTAKWQSVTDKMKSGGMNMVKTFQGYWASITAGWLAASAAIETAWDWTQEYAKHEQSMMSFGTQVRKLGLDTVAEFDKIRAASGGLVDDKALVESANKALSLGIPIEKLAGFLEIARAKARDMGTDTKTAFSDLVVALGRGSAPILDNLGIIVKTEQANQAYASSIGKTVEQLTDAEKKQAFMNAALDAGRESLTRQDLAVRTFNEDIEKTRATLENAKTWMGQLLSRAIMYLQGVALAGGTYILVLYSAILKPLAAAEKLLNDLGISTSTAIRDSLSSAQQTILEWREASIKSFGMVIASSEDLARALGGGGGGSLVNTVQVVGGQVDFVVNGSLESMNRKLTKLRESLGDMAVGSREYVAAMMQISAIEKRIADENELAVMRVERANVRLGINTHNTLEGMKKKWAEYWSGIKLQQVADVEFSRGLTAQMEDDLTQRMNVIQSVMSGMLSSLQETFQAIFSGDAIQGVRNFMKGVLLVIIDTVQAYIMAAAAMAWAKGVMTFGFSTFSDLPLIAAATIGLQALRGLVSEKFHSGGIVPKVGSSYVDAPASSERLVMVRGGETIRTEEQEASLRTGGGGASITINVNGPVSTAQAFKEIIERGMRETGITDAAQYFKNSRNNLVLQS